MIFKIFLLKLFLYFLDIKSRFFTKYNVTKINLCCGTQVIPGYVGVDFQPKVDVIINLSWGSLPFLNESASTIVCISGINYFTRKRSSELINEVYRVLEKGGVARFATQDLELIANRYVARDRDFFFQKDSFGEDRFEGVTLGDKFNQWFYGYRTIGGGCKYFYDYETLEQLFKSAGFKEIYKKRYLDSIIDDVSLIDNRPDQMFFLEAIK